MSMDYRPKAAALLDEFPELQHERVMGFCGCGRPDDVLNYVCQILAAIGTDSRDWTVRLAAIDVAFNLPDKEHMARGLILYYLDHMGFLEHGGYIGGSWLSSKGKQLVAAWTALGAGTLDEALDSAEHEALNPEDKASRLKP